MEPITKEPISDDVNFILNHFVEPYFPRTISTGKSRGKQFEVFSKEDMIKTYEESNFVDCRVNAFPSYTEYKGIQRYPPNFLFADLDISTSTNLESLEKILQITLRTIRIKINGIPTVLWTGNGYHIYQPIDAVILEEYEQFAQFEHPSLKFIRFAEFFLTGGKSDPSHNPSFKSCMIRIPGSRNSKCLPDKNEVKIYQRWDSYRPRISLLLGSFHAFLVDQKIKETKLKKRIEKRYGITIGRSNSIHWIEALLQTPIEDYRKNAIALILAPYLINVRKISYDIAFSKIKEWLTKCNELRNLDSNFDYRIKSSLYTAIKKQSLPMRLDTLEMKSKQLHRLLTRKLKFGNL